MPARMPAPPARATGWVRGLRLIQAGANGVGRQCSEPIPFGLCEYTKVPIPRTRLELMPWTALSIEGAVHMEDNHLTLEDVLARTDPSAAQVHAPTNGSRPSAFTPLDRAALLAFLRAL